MAEPDTKSEVNRRRVLVVGGGISGLSLAHFLARDGGDTIDVRLAESEPRVGGTMGSELVDGFLLERGYYHSGQHTFMLNVLGVNGVATTTLVNTPSC